MFSRCNSTCLRNAASSVRLASACCDGVRQFNVIGRGVERVGQVQRNVFPDVARQIVAEQIGQVVFGDAIIIPRLNQGRAFVGDGDLGAQHVEMRHRAGVVAALLVFQFLLQQIHGCFMDGDLLRGQQHVVIRQPRAQASVSSTTV
jgi:hypothetical protein